MSPTDWPYKDLDMAMSQPCKCGHLAGEHYGNCLDDNCKCPKFEAEDG